MNRHYSPEVRIIILLDGSQIKAYYVYGFDHICDRIALHEDLLFHGIPGIHLFLLRNIDML